MLTVRVSKSWSYVVIGSWTQSATRDSQLQASRLVWCQLIEMNRCPIMITVTASTRSHSRFTKTVTFSEILHQVPAEMSKRKQNHSNGDEDDSDSDVVCHISFIMAHMSQRNYLPVESHRCRLRFLRSESKCRLSCTQTAYIPIIPIRCRSTATTWIYGADTQPTASRNDHQDRWDGKRPLRVFNRVKPTCTPGG